MAIFLNMYFKRNDLFFRIYNKYFKSFFKKKADTADMIKQSNFSLLFHYYFLESSKNLKCPSGIRVLLNTWRKSIFYIRESLKTGFI